MKRLKHAPQSIVPEAPPGVPRPAPVAPLAETLRQVRSQPVDALGNSVTPYDAFWFPGRPVRP